MSKDTTMDTANQESEFPFCSEIPGLLEKHYEAHIKGSGIADDVALERGYKSILGKAELKKLRFAESQRRAGLAIPVYSPDGENVYHQLRPDNPRLNGKDKPIKYETPSGVAMRLDVHPRCREDIKNPSIPLFITEGLKKEDALVSRGQCAIGLLGVWNFKGKNKFDGTALLADWDYIALNGRLVYIVFDSDIMTKPEVRQALNRITEHLQRKGAKVFHIYLPSPDGKKVGVDDYLLDHSIDEILTLAREPATAPQFEEQKKQNTRATTFLFNGDWLVELIRDGDDTAYILFNTKTGELGKHSGVQLEDGTLIVPPEKNLIMSNIVWFSRGIEEYGREDELFLKVQAFINRYVELGEFLNIASLYVLLSWLYDRFTELPYLRFMGDYGTGKSRALTVIGSICYKPFFTFGASTVSPIFRLLDAFRGTMILDEADHKDSGLWNELIKILNTGFQANIPLLRTEGDKKKEVKAFHVFGPKLIATRRPFYDDALESRCLTKIMSPGARRKGIPINLPTRFNKEAENLRNQLLPFRFRNYLGTEIDENAYIPNLEDRLNQVLLPLFSIARDEFKRILTDFSKKLQERILETRSESLEGLTIRALCELPWEEDEITVKRVAEKIEMLGVKEITSQKTGRLIRSLGFETKRSTKITGKPFIVLINADRLQSLAIRYGINENMEEQGEIS